MECLRDIEESFVEQTALAEFDLDEHVSCHAGVERDFFLSEPPFEAKRADPCADSLACLLPSSCAIGIVLAGACRHAPQS